MFSAALDSLHQQRKAETKLERIQPEQIIAIVVGIEKYADESLDVSGPAGDATRFVRWLLDDCGVPAANIRLHLSPLDGFDDRLGVERHAAATDPIKHSLVDFPEQYPEAKMLILYWIGHGAYVPGNHDQALYLETANQNCLDCLETNTLREFLQKHSWGQSDCLRRLVMIDACANQRRPVATAALELKAHPRNLQPKINLCEMRSASLGQVAHIANFSKALLDWLKGGDQNWLLNKTGDLIERLEGELRTACKNNDFDQRPVFWQLGDWEGKTKSQRFPLEAEWMEDAERLLRCLNIADNQFGAIYRRVADRLGGRARANSLMEMIEDLCEPRPARKDKTGLPPLLEFVARVAESGWPSEVERESLRQLVECHLDGNQLATLSDAMAIEKRQGQISGERLLFDLMISSEAPGKFIFKAIRQTNPGDYVPFSNLPTGALTLDEIEYVVAECIADSDQPFVEFFLPKDLISLEVDRWKFSHSTIGDMFPVVVRVRERSEGQLPKPFLRNWHVVSDRVRQVIDAANSKIYWPTNADQSPGKLMPHIMKNDYGACVAFSASPETRALEEMLFGGAPFAVWPRQSPNAAEKFKRAVNAKFRKNHFNQLPEEVRALRQAGDSGSDMTLLWDEPTPVPLKKFTPLD